MTDDEASWFDEPILVQDPLPLVRVPDLVGLMWADARAIGEQLGFWVRRPEPEEEMALPLPAVAGTVVDQEPRAGTVVPLGTWLVLWAEDGPDASGVREPRRPKPAPRSLAGYADEDAATAD